MTDDEILGALSVPYRFRRRPISVPGDLRIGWRVALLVSILASFHGKRANMKQLHVLNWAIRTAKAREIFLSILNGTRDPNIAVVRFEPALNRAVEFAVGEGLVERISGAGVALTPRGMAYAATLSQEEDCLSHERQFLQQVKGRVTQKAVDSLLAWRT